MATTTLAAPVMVSNDLLTGAEWSPAHTRELLAITADIKANPASYADTLRGKFIALIFEKPSLRTRVTFEVGIQSMGGHVVFLDHTQARLGERESIADVARNLERWVQGIVARVYEQRVLEEMAATTDIPVINALSDKFHPCQALADFFTLEEKFGTSQRLQARLRRRRQQRLSLADVSRRASWREFAYRNAGKITLPTPTSSPIPSASQRKPKPKSNSSPTRAKLWKMSRPFTPIPGPAWASKPRKKSARKSSSLIRSIANSWRLPDATPFSCTACPPIAATKSHTEILDGSQLCRARPIRKSHVRAEGDSAHALSLKMVKV